MKFHVGKNKIASLYYIFSSVITKVIMFLITPLITRAVTPSEFGVYVIYTGYLSIVSVFSTLEMSGAGIYKELSGRKNENDFIFSLLVCQAALSLSLSFIYLLLQKQINAYTSLSTPLSLLLILQVFFNSVEGLHLAKARYLLEYRKCAFINLGTGVFGAALSLFLVLKLSLSGEGRIYAHILTSLIFVLPVIASVLSHKPKFDRTVFVYIKKTLLPLLPHYLSLSVIAQSGRIVISKTLGEAAVGSYGAAGTLSLAVSLVTTGLSNALFPWINRSFCPENATRVVSTLKKCTLLISGFTAVFLLFVPFLYRALYPSEYLSALWCVYPLALGQVFAFLSGIYSQLLYRFDRAGTVSLVSLSGAVLCVFLSFFLVRTFSVFGVGIAFLIAEAATVLLKALLLMRDGFKSLSVSALPIAYSLLFFSPQILLK